MELSFEQLYALIKEMQIELKVLLFQRLQSELAQENEQIPDWHKELIEQRLAKYQSNPAEVVHWKDFEKHLYEKYGV